MHKKMFNTHKQMINELKKGKNKNDQKLDVFVSYVRSLSL